MSKRTTHARLRGARDRNAIRPREDEKPPVENQVRTAGGPFLAALGRRFSDSDLLAQAAALAFYALLSLAPLLLLLLWLTASLVPSAQDALMRQLGLLAGGEAQRVAKTVLENASRQPDTGSLAGWWSIVLLFFGATAVFAQLQNALNRIFRTDAQKLGGMKAWLRKRMFGFGLVFGLGFLLLVSMTVNTVLQLIFGQMEWLWPVVASIATWLVYTLGFALMYHYLPDRHVRWRRAVGGGALTAALMIVGRAVIGWYLNRSDPGSAYGSMGALVITLVWVYYAGLIVFVGALLTAVVDERRKRDAS